MMFFVLYWLSLLNHAPMSSAVSIDVNSTEYCDSGCVQGLFMGMAIQSAAEEVERAYNAIPAALLGPQSEHDLEELNYYAAELAYKIAYMATWRTVSHNDLYQGCNLVCIARLGEEVNRDAAHSALTYVSHETEYMQDQYKAVGGSIEEITRSQQKLDVIHKRIGMLAAHPSTYGQVNEERLKEAMEQVEAATQEGADGLPLKVEARLKAILLQAIVQDDVLPVDSYTRYQLTQTPNLPMFPSPGHASIFESDEYPSVWNEDASKLKRRHKGRQAKRDDAVRQNAILQGQDLIKSDRIVYRVVRNAFSPPSPPAEPPALRPREYPS